MPAINEVFKGKIHRWMWTNNNNNINFMRTWLNNSNMLKLTEKITDLSSSSWQPIMIIKGAHKIKTH